MKLFPVGALIGSLIAGMMYGVITLDTDEAGSNIKIENIEIKVLNSTGYQSKIDIYEQDVLAYHMNGTFIPHGYGNQVFFVLNIDSNAYTQQILLITYNISYYDKNETMVYVGSHNGTAIETITLLPGTYEYHLESYYIHQHIKSVNDFYHTKISDIVVDIRAINSTT